MNSMDRERLEEEVHTLAHQCKCYSYDGPCRACLKREKLNQQLDKMQAEEDIVHDILEWLQGLGPKLGCPCGGRIAEAIARGEWRQKDVKESGGPAVVKP